MKIDEVVVEKNFVMEKDDPYGFSLKFMDMMSEFGQIFERKNEFMTDGPEQRSRVEFDMVDVMDKFSRIQFSFSMESAMNKLSVNAKGSFDVNADEYGFMSSIVSEYYFGSIYPAVRKLSMKKIESVEKFVEDSMSAGV
jgi:hypothetical protein